VDLVVRNVEVGAHRGLDVLIAEGRVVQIGRRLRAAQVIDGAGGALIPGLIDHHIHILASAARADTVTLADARGADEVTARLRRAAADRPVGAWIRAAGYHEHHCGILDRARLDEMLPAHPLRVEHQSGSLWVLNSLALDQVATPDAPPALERDALGRATGNIWRGEHWLRERLGRIAPPLAPVGRMLAALGVTGLMDASATTDADTAQLLADAHRAKDLPQRIALMSAGPLCAPADAAISVGPVKFLLDDHALPDLEHLEHALADARRQQRAAAFHCVTHGELALALAALDAAGTRRGDRIEHGGLIAAHSIADLQRLQLTVVTQPSFIRERGDRYLNNVDVDAQADLYRCGSLVRAGVSVAGSTDAPYGSIDPWAAMRAAVARRTLGDRPIGTDEAIEPAAALDLFQSALHDCGGAPRQIVAGGPADLCLLNSPLDCVLRELSADAVAATLVNGEIIYRKP
jgi:predicted amidohydrolase YtcJ